MLVWQVHLGARVCNWVCSCFPNLPTISRLTSHVPCLNFHHLISIFRCFSAYLPSCVSVCLQGTKAVIFLLPAILSMLSIYLFSYPPVSLLVYPPAHLPVFSSCLFSCLFSHNSSKSVSSLLLAFSVNRQNTIGVYIILLTLIQFLENKQNFVWNK